MEDVIKACLTGVYSTSGDSKYILSDCSSEFSSKQLDFLAKEFYQALSKFVHPPTPLQEIQT